MQASRIVKSGRNMRVFRATYKTKEGDTRTAKKWYVELRDHLHIIRRFPAFEEKKLSEMFGRQIERLVDYRIAGQLPDRQLTLWLKHVPEKLQNRFVSISLLDSTRVAAGKPLSKHLEDFHKSLKVGNTKRYADVTYRRVKRIFDSCGFKYWIDIKGHQVQQTIAGFHKTVQTVETKTINGKKTKRKRLKDLGEISDKSKNYYLGAVQHFCRWMVDDQRAYKSPVKHLLRLDLTGDEHRRALCFAEVCCLLEATEKAPRRFGLEGHERAVLYLLAIETGLRVRELQSLKVSSFDFENCIVTVDAKFCKNRKEAEQLLKYKRAAQFKEYFADKQPDGPAFNMPTHHYTADMLKADLAEAGIAYMDDAGRKADFYSLRHTLATALDKAGATLKERMAIMRHSDKSNLTLGTYSHVQIYDIKRVIENLPDYPWPGSQQMQQAKATGTYDIDIGTNVFANCLAKSQQDNHNQPERTGEAFLDSDIETPVTNGPGRIRTYDQWIMSPLL